MRIPALLAVVALACPPAFAFSWTDLWVSREQQAQHLLDSGHPAEAAALFSAPRRQAYAQLEAGQYAQASQALAPYPDANSQYNRGNALARMGNLPAALAAYDEALKRAPRDADVIHNRDLVAAALRQQQRNQTPKGGSSKSSTDQSGGASSPGHSADTAPSRSGSAGHSGTESSNSSPTEESGPAHSPSRKSATPKTAESGLENMQGERSAAHLSSSVAQPSGSEPNPHPLSSEDMPAAVQATDTPKSAPASEQSIAMDQWLRSIPDDSAELLRRKFFIEHMMKQQPGAK